MIEVRFAKLSFGNEVFLAMLRKTASAALLFTLIVLFANTACASRSKPIEGGLNVGALGGGQSDPVDAYRVNMSVKLFKALKLPIDSNRETSALTKLHRSAERLGEAFEHRRFSCSVAMHKDGSISNIRIVRSSGSDQIDQKAKKLIADAVPFGSPPQNRQLFVVEFPSLAVKLP